MSNLVVAHLPRRLCACAKKTQPRLSTSTFSDQLLFRLAFFSVHHEFTGNHSSRTRSNRSAMGLSPSRLNRTFFSLTCCYSFLPRWQRFFHPSLDSARTYASHDRLAKLSDLFSCYGFLSSSKVNPDTPAHAWGLSAGDQVISINGRHVTNVSHQEAKMEITRAGNELELTVIK